MGMKTLPYVTLVIAKTILFCIQNGGAYVQTNKQTDINKTDGVKGQHAAFIALARIGIQVLRKE